MGERMTTATAIVTCLAEAGISHAFCVPGESYLPLMDAMLGSPVQLIATRHEGGASFMAEGYAKARGKPGVVMATRGVGAANVCIGVHTACQDSTPMVVLLGQVNRNARGREGFQEVDLERFFSPIAKWTVEVGKGARVVEILERALRIAQSGRPGPVVISLPEDVLRETHVFRFGPTLTLAKPRPSTEEILAIAECLQTARTPLLIAGGGVIAGDGEAALLRFAQRFRLPVVSSFRRQHVFPNHHSLYLGHLGLGASRTVVDAVKEADVILAIGTRLSEVTTQGYSLISTKQKLVHIDICADVLGKAYPPDIGVVADARQALTALAELAPKHTPWEGWEVGYRQQYESALQLATPQPYRAIELRDVVYILREELEEPYVITNDAGNFSGWLHHFFPFSHPKSYVGPTSGAMGYGLPAALGVKCARPETLVVSLSGDGGFVMTCQELETAVRHGLSVICLVFNNSMYGTIRMHQERAYPGRVIGTDLGAVSFVKLAESLGARGYRVTTPSEFRQAFHQGRMHDGPTLIEIPMNREQITPWSTIS